MRADMVAGLFMALLAIGGAGGAYFWYQQNQQADLRQYEAAVDYVIEGQLSAGRLSSLYPGMAQHSSARLNYLRQLYADPAQSRQLNLGFAWLRANWDASYERVADQFNREVDPQRLRLEIDERFGEGAFVLMRQQHEQFVRDAPRLAADEAAKRDRNLQQMVRSYQAFVAEHHRPPRNGEELPIVP